jgi:glycosyltransferase involved in cell wall biosynthesis
MWFKDSKQQFGAPMRPQKSADQNISPDSVAIVIPVFNGAGYIAAAIDSALAQVGCTATIAVIDDGSTDDTARILKRYGERIAVIRQSNAGTSAAWNTALKTLGHKYLLGLDADDELLPHSLATMMSAVRAEPSHDIWYSDYEFVDHEGNTSKVVCNPDPTNPVSQLICLHDRLGEPDNFLPFGHVRLYNRERILEAGGFDVSYRYAEDYEIVLRLAVDGYSFFHVPEVLYRYRWHTTNKGVLTRNEQIADVRRAVSHYQAQEILRKQGLLTKGA